MAQPSVGRASVIVDGLITGDARMALHRGGSIWCPLVGEEKKGTPEGKAVDVLKGTEPFLLSLIACSLH